jgi:hypothetical protein
LNKSSTPQSSSSLEPIILAELALGVFALVFFLLFSGGESVPEWYSLGTTVIEGIANLTAAGLCLRNWRSSQIVSGRGVWLCIGLGMLAYCLGNILFAYWEGLNINPDVSAADFLFIPAYIFLLLGMILAMRSRRLNLEIWQWGVVILIAILGAAVAYVTTPQDSALLHQREAVASQRWMAPQSERSVLLVASDLRAEWPSGSLLALGGDSPSFVGQVDPGLLAQASKPTAKPTPKAVPAKKAAPSPAATTPSKSSDKSETASPDKKLPGWVQFCEDLLTPFKKVIKGFYVVSDVFLLIFAAILLLAFWGGRFAQSWRMIAAAAVCFYIADIWFNKAAQSENYQSGHLMEVFWIFSAIFFGMGAAIEYDLSSRSSRKRGGGRRKSAG